MKRKEAICNLVEDYYKKYDVLHSKSLEVLQNKVLEMFLNTNLSIDEINLKLQELLFKRKSNLVMQSQKISSKKKGYLNIFVFLEICSILIMIITIYMLAI